MTSIDSGTDYEKMAAQLRVASLAVLGVPVAVVAALTAWLGAPQVLPAVLGAAGWMIALALRQPVALVATRLTTRERAMTIMGLTSGPAEEIVRLLLVLLVLRSASAATWAGAGWMTIEVALVTVNTLIIANLLPKDDPESLEAKEFLRGLANLLPKDDPESLEAKEFLRGQGMMQDNGPVWGVVERFSAAGIHIGFTLLLFAQPWLVLVTIVLHSLTNMLVVRYAKRSIAHTELALLAVAIVVLAAGVVAGGFPV